MEPIVQFLKSINLLDVFVIIVFAISVFEGYRKGLMRSVFNLFSFAISLLLSNSFYPIVSKALRENGGFYDSLKGTIIKSLQISEVAQPQTLKAQMTMINELKVPDFVSKLLISNNNSELYKIFNVTGVEEYVASYIANMIFNALALLLVFALVSIAMKMIGKSLNIVARLPVISTLNRLGGAFCGVIIATVVVWLTFATISVFFINKPIGELLSKIGDSKLAFYFYQNNVIMDFITKINI